MHDWRFLRTGDLLTLSGLVWRVDMMMISGDEAGQIEWVRLEGLLDRKCQELTPAQLSEAFLANHLQIQAKNGRPQDLYPLMGEQLEPSARVRLYYLEAYDRIQPSRSTKKLQKFVDAVHRTADFPHQKPGATTVATWVRSRGRPGLRRPNEMRDRRHRGQSGPRELAYAVEIFEGIFDIYLRSVR